MSSLSFATRVLQNYGSSKDCPFCGSKDTKLAGRRNVLLQLRACEKCGLRFRWPQETSSFSEKYYQDAYHEAGTTDLPDPEILSQYKANNFAGSPRNIADQIAVFRQFLPKGRVLDFGCSWGYGTFQLCNAGFDAFGFEISRPRAEAGRRELGVEILDRLEDMDSLPAQSLDGVFASHVFEHLSSLKEIFANLARILKPGGVLAIMVPNAGGKMARELGTGWATMINEKHTLALDGKFFEKNLTPFGFQVTTFADPYDPPKIFAAAMAREPLAAEGEELMVIAQRLPS